MHHSFTEQSRTLFREIDGVINAKQTRQLKPYASIPGPSRSSSLEIPKLGFLKTNRGVNANVEDSPNWRNQDMNFHEEYSIPISSKHNSATRNILCHLNGIIISIPIIALILQ